MLNSIVITLNKQRMDSFTLTLVIIMFLSCLGLHFVTALVPPVIPPPPPITMLKIPLMSIPITTSIRPAVLRQNVAIARFMRVEELG